MSETLPIIPAATLVLMREREGAAPELLMTERTAGMAFAGGALVFPGGRIDPADEAEGAAFPDLPYASARIAALRETIEETGIIPALDGPPGEELTGRLRDQLHAGRPLLGLLRDFGLEPRLDRLTPFARWCPNFPEARRFDTLFFIAEAPVEAPEPKVSEAEAVRAFWSSAAETLAEIQAGRARAIFPTIRNLERLATFASLEEARASAERFAVQKITPWVEEREGEAFLCIPDDAGYPVTAEPLKRAKRR